MSALSNYFLSGSGNSHIVTLVERHSRFTTLIQVPSKDPAVEVAALIRHVGKLPAALRRSWIWDRGLEMAKHKTFTMTADVGVYFGDPQSPWHSNENTNGSSWSFFPAWLLALPQNLLNSAFRKWQMVFILLQPLVVILLDGISPAGVNLTCGVLAFLQALMSEKIAQMSFF
jgi:hypothetical protein